MNWGSGSKQTGSVQGAAVPPFHGHHHHGPGKGGMTAMEWRVQGVGCNTELNKKDSHVPAVEESKYKDFPRTLCPWNPRTLTVMIYELVRR